MRQNYWYPEEIYIQMGQKTLGNLFPKFYQASYGSVIYGCCTQEESQRIEHLQLKAAHIVAESKKGTSHDCLLWELSW